MIKRMATAAALAALLASAALAQSPAPVEAPATPPAAAASSPTAPQTTDGTTTGSVPAPRAEAPTGIPDTAEACIAAAADLGTAAEGKTIAEEKLDQLDVLFSKMETLCDGNQFDAAMTVAKDIKTMLDGQ